jgi:hypothetical protein
MTCTEFQSWLDEGRTKRELPRMNEHRVGCPLCEQALAAADEVDRLLAIVVPAAVDTGFNDAVMRQIRSETRRHALLSVFVNGVSEPIVPVSLAIVIMIAGRFRTVLGFVSGIVPRAIGHFPGNLSGLSAGAIGLAIFWISWRLFRTCEEMTSLNQGEIGKSI